MIPRLAPSLPPLEMAGVSRDMLRTPLEAGEASREETKAFIRDASRRDYRIATEIIRRRDPDHLILGSSLTLGWHSSCEWEAGSVDFVDAFSFDCHASTADWIEPHLGYEKAYPLAGYSFVVSGRGTSRTSGQAASSWGAGWFAATRRSRDETSAGKGSAATLV